MNYIDICLNATKVRKVVEQNWSTAPCIDGFEPFPSGWCRLVTDILGAYLKKLDPEGAYEIVIAEIDERSHAWLEHNGYIIDITADQFKELTNQPVIVEKTEESMIHKRFGVEEKKPLYIEGIHSYQPESYLLSKLQENTQIASY